MPQRLLDGFDAGSRRTKHNGMGMMFRFLWHSQVTVNTSSPIIQLKTDQVTIDFVGTILLGQFSSIGKGIFCSLLFVVLPEVVEIFGFLRIWFDILHGESYFYMMGIFLSINLYTQSQITESRCLTCSYINLGTSIF